MLSDFITEEAFSAGLRVSPAAPLAARKDLAPHRRVHLCPQTYLKEFAYNSTTYTDLWRHLQTVRHRCGR